MRPDPNRSPVPPHEPKLLDQIRGRLRVKHYSIRTEQSYVDWVRRFVLFHDKRHPRDLGATEFEAFLTDLAVRVLNRGGRGVRSPLDAHRGNVSGAPDSRCA